VVATVTEGVGDEPTGVAITPDGSLAYVADAKGSIIDTSTNTVVAIVPVGSEPIALGNFVARLSSDARAPCRLPRPRPRPTPAPRRTPHPR
jgi:YVTN family beta-propeller protein